MTTIQWLTVAASLTSLAMSRWTYRELGKLDKKDPR